MNHVNRVLVLDKLRPSVLDLLVRVERKTNLEFQFRELPRDFNTVVAHSFDPMSGAAVIALRADWEDVDVAHSLVYAQLLLVDGYHFLTWRPGATVSDSVAAAFGVLGSYVNSQAVHARLAEAGFRVDGEVFKRQLFDDICTNVPRYLKEGRTKANDGMAHFDAIGYGDLRRTAFLVEAEWALSSFGSQIGERPRGLLADFITTFREHRIREAAKADLVLSIFRQCDVRTAEGHKQILMRWIALEELDRYVALGRYTSLQGRYMVGLTANPMS